MNCPKCRKTRMQPEDYAGIEVDRCPDCMGIFFDKGELEGMLAKKMGGRADTQLLWVTAAGIDQAPAICPRCEKEMDATRGPEDIRVDLCPLCAGVFLDQGELASMQLYKISSK